MSLTPVTPAQPIAPSSAAARPVPDAATPHATATNTAAWLENPYPGIDPGLNIVVLEFHDESGQVTRTIPSEQVLAAYRLHGVPGR